MLIVETYIAPSKLHGIGLFAGAPIEKHAIIAWFEANFDNQIAPPYFSTLNPATQKCIEQYAFSFEQDECRILFFDNGRFINHSPAGNICYAKGVSISNVSYARALCALRNIPSGEELTFDYREACPRQYKAICNFIEMRDAKNWPPKVPIPE